MTTYRTRYGRAIHSRLAQNVMEKRRLGPVDACQAIMHFVAAQKYNEAAFVLLLALNGLLEAEDPKDYMGISGIWAHSPLPHDIAHGTKVYIRSLQIAVRQRLGHSVGSLLEDIKRLSEEREPEDELKFLTVVVGGTVAASIGREHPEVATGHLLRSIKALRDHEPDFGPSDASELRDHLLKLLWMIGVYIGNSEQFEIWFAAVQELTPSEVREWVGLDIVDEVSRFICNDIWMRQAKHQNAASSWADVSHTLERVRSWALAANAESMAIHALCGQIIVTAEYEKEIDRAVALAGEGLAQHKGHPKAQFWIADITARQFYYLHRPVEALEWFERALGSQDAIDPASRISTLITAGAAAGTLSSVAALTYLRQAIDLLGSAGGEVPPLLRVKAWGELGIAQWEANDRPQCYDSWNHAAEELLACKTDTDEWKILFQLFGNCSGYFVQTAHGIGQAHWDSAIPGPGFLLRQPEQVAELYKPETEWLLGGQMALFADAVGAYDSAAHWGDRVYRSRPPGRGMRVALSGFALPRLLADRRLAEIVDEASRRETESPDAGEDAIRESRAIIYAGHLDVVCVTIELARLGLRDVELARSLARDVARRCQATGAAGGSTEFWSRAGEAMEALYDQSQSWRDVYARGTQFGHEDGPLQAIYSVAAMPSAPPSAAAQIQLYTLPWLEDLLSRTVYHFTVARFVPEFWSWAFDRYPMHFGFLRLTRSSVAEAGTLDGRERVKAVLRAVVLTLGVSVDQYRRTWLGAG